MSSTCFEHEGSSSGSNTPSFYKTTCTDACKTHYTVPEYTTVFLKMNPWFRNM